jgi:hypothetical protein
MTQEHVALSFVRGFFTEPHEIFAPIHTLLTFAYE